jgi:hypothetical protein
VRDEIFAVAFRKRFRNKKLCGDIRRNLRPQDFVCAAKSLSAVHSHRVCTREHDNFNI